MDLQTFSLFAKKFKPVMQIDKVKSQIVLKIDIKKIWNLKKQLQNSAKRNTSSTGTMEGAAKRKKRQKRKAERASAKEVEQKKNISSCTPASVEEREQKVSKKKIKRKVEKKTSSNLKNKSKVVSSDINKGKKRDKSMSSNLIIIDNASVKPNKKSKIEKYIKNTSPKCVEAKTKFILGEPYSKKLHQVLEGKRKKRKKSKRKTLQANLQEEKQCCVKDFKSVTQINIAESQAELGIEWKKVRKLKKRIRNAAKSNASSDETAVSNEYKITAKSSSALEVQDNISCRRAFSVKPKQIVSQKKSGGKSRDNVMSILAKNRNEVMISGKKKREGEISSIAVKNRMKAKSSEIMKNKDEALSSNMKRRVEVSSVDKKRKRRDESTLSDTKDREKVNENTRKTKNWKETQLSNINIKEPLLIKKDVYISEKNSDCKRYSSGVKKTSSKNFFERELPEKKPKKNIIIMMEEISNLGKKENKKGMKQIKGGIDDQTSHKIMTSDEDQIVKKLKTRRSGTSSTEDKHNSTISGVKSIKSNVQNNSLLYNDDITDKTCQSVSDIFEAEEEKVSSINNQMSKKKDLKVYEASVNDRDIVHCDEERPMFTEEETRAHHQFQLKEIDENKLRKVKAIQSKTKIDDKVCETFTVSTVSQIDFDLELYKKKENLQQADSRKDSKQHTEDIAELEDHFCDCGVVFNTLKKDTGCLADCVAFKKKLIGDYIKTQEPVEKSILLRNVCSEQMPNSIFNVYKEAESDCIDVFYDGNKNPINSLKKQRVEEEALLICNNASNSSSNSNITSQNEEINKVIDVEIIEQTDVNIENLEMTNDNSDHVSNAGNNDDETHMNNNQLKLIINEEDICPSDVESKKEFCTDIGKSNEEKECNNFNGTKEENCSLNNESKSSLEMEDFKQSFNTVGKETVFKNDVESLSSQELLLVSGTHSNMEWEITSEISKLGKEQSGELNSTMLVSPYDAKEIGISIDFFLNGIEANIEVSEDNLLDDLTPKMEKLDSNKTSPALRSSNAAVANETIISPQVNNVDNCPSGLPGEIEDVEKETKNSSSLIRRSPRVSINSQKRKKVNEKESPSKDDLTSDNQSDERGKVLSSVKTKYSLRSLRNLVTPEKQTVTRRLRNSLPSIICEKSEAKL